MVEHCVGPLGVGTLVVKPVRHVTGVDDLSDDEAAELGPLLRRASRVARELTAAEQVYNCLWSHAGRRPGHLHYVVQPVGEQQVARHDAVGPELQTAMFTLDEPPDPEAVERFAGSARELFAAAAPGGAAAPRCRPGCPCSSVRTTSAPTAARTTGRWASTTSGRPSRGSPDGPVPCAPGPRTSPGGCARRSPRWCAAEYLCHVRDVFATFTIRLHRARTEDDPALESMLNDLRARRFDYRAAALDPVLDQLDAHARGFLAELDRVGDDDWLRPVHRYPGEHRSLRWLARQAAHEGRHHLLDITALLPPR